MRMLSVNGKLPNYTFRIIKKMVPVLAVLTWQWLFMASVSTILQHRVQFEGSKALHARRWQTKDGTYRLKRHALPDVRDAPHVYHNAAASSTDANPRWRDWDDDYTMGY